MKKLVLFFMTALLFISAGLLFERETKLKNKHKKTYELAEYYFTSEDYELSEKHFRELADNYPEDGYFQFKLGFSLFELDREEDAILAFDKAIDLGLEEAHFYRARASHKLEKFDAALTHYKLYGQYRQKLKTDAIIKAEISAVERAKLAYANPVNVKIKNAGAIINSKYEDYVPLISPDGNKLVFTSKRPDETAKKQGFGDALYEDIFVSEKTNGIWGKPVQLGSPINTSQHDANVCFSADGKSLIIYRNEKNRSSGNLFSSQFVDGAWAVPIKLPETINSSYHEPSAALNPKGDKLYLVSNRPGSLGERDLFLLNKLPNGEWSEPINLGKTINTEFNEDAPFVDPTGKYLYFSSEGHNGIGGYDIFKSRILADGTLDRPVSMEYPINTVLDDIYFSITEDGKTAYYSSYKTNDTQGKQDIYEIDFLFEDADHVIVKGQVLNEKKDALKAHVELKDENANLIQQVFSAPENGNFLMSVIPDRKYELSVSHEGYETYTKIIEPKIARKGEFAILKLDIILKEKKHE